ncbi:AAA family ATPase [Gorillibacterium sp. sgz5001074]|uniref:AAA family ATPase n=1 Tax=Gorillibacterium sp. sgz5001074 TaxID=3446695 RepID=UPI003F66ECFD
MNQGRMIIITGSPGTGKSTTASLVAKKSHFSKSVHMHTDDFYGYIRKGAIPPFLPESQEQNVIVMEAFLEAAKRFARGGFDVIIDGIVGPWFLEPWQKAVQDHYEVHYIILRATKEETMNRAINRSKLDKDANTELVEKMWEQFNHLGPYESHIMDTTNQSTEQSVSTILAVIERKSSLLT